jgi:hypothetical protein
MTPFSILVCVLGCSAATCYSSPRPAEGFGGRALLVKAGLTQNTADSDTFVTTNRPGGQGLIDIWVSTRETQADAWPVTMDLGSAVNLGVDDGSRWLSRDRTIALRSPRLGVTGFAIVAEAQASDRPSFHALAFFAALPAADIGTLLHALRPPSISEAAHARALAVLPISGELRPDGAERTKLAMLEAVLGYHERDGVFETKVIDVPQAVVALHQRAVLMISRSALRLLSSGELQALVAHEIGHEYFWPDFEQTLQLGDSRGRQEVELKCDGIAVLTLVALGLDTSLLTDGLHKQTQFNEMLGATANADDYPQLHERQRFVKAVREFAR